jgi:hypothetical protein
MPLTLQGVFISIANPTPNVHGNSRTIWAVLTWGQGDLVYPTPLWVSRPTEPSGLPSGYLLAPTPASGTLPTRTLLVKFSHRISDDKLIAQGVYGSAWDYFEVVGRAQADYNLGTYFAIR